MKNPIKNIIFGEIEKPGDDFARKLQVCDSELGLNVNEMVGFLNGVLATYKLNPNFAHDFLSRSVILGAYVEKKYPGTFKFKETQITKIKKLQQPKTKKEATPGYMG